MCGIAGSFGISTEQHKVIVKNILSCIEHRGRKGTQYEIMDYDKFGAIGTNRLPIVKESNNIQPVTSPGESIILVMNGQVYNYKDLFLELSKEGTIFDIQQPGDTVVLCAAIEKWGIKHTLDKVVWEGVFIAIDKINELIIVARDHIGIKPLYYTITEYKEIQFASEIKALSKTNNHTLKHIEPGSFYTFNLCTIKLLDVVKWWTPESIQTKLNPVNIELDLLELLTKAVKDRVPEEPYAILLSGGIDSSIILKLCIQFNSNITAYVLHSKDSPDLPYAREICKDLGIQIREIDIESPKSMFSNVKNLIKTLETWEWHVINHAAPMEKLFDIIRKDNFKVVLTGEGADELFFGYDSYTDKIDSNILSKNRIRRIKNLHRTNCLRIDRMGMSKSLECRVPFLDRRVTEFALSLDPSQCIKDGYNKKPLRDILKKIYSDKFAYRKKMSFAKGVGFNYGYSNVESVYGAIDYDKNILIPNKWSHLPRYPLERLFLSYFLEIGYGKAEYLRSRSV